MSTPPPYRCPTCQGASVNPRNLAVFIDGETNKPGDRNTNVMKLFSQVKSAREGAEPEQRQCYFKGIGAYDIENLPLLERVGKVIYSPLEIVFAWNAGKNVKDAYNWLVETYRDGDQIYLFGSPLAIADDGMLAGFSGGGYQVRALAALIHEVGLVKETRDADSAYDHYLSIDPYNVETRRKAMMFRKEFCRVGVRIHFVGLWDAVSSLGLIKKDVHLTASAAVTNACHFRHALALDEHRVKFMPEYFAEVNAHRSNIRSPRSAVSDVKEVWFAGSHSDIGGISRGHYEVCSYSEDDDSGSHPVHAGNVPLLWMRREATANGLVFKPEEFAWDPEDVDLGRKDSMTGAWKLFEMLPIRHQVSFSGTGKHEWRWHRARTRPIIPGQQIHSSVLSGDVYTPRATLQNGVDIPTGPQGASDRLWTTELSDERETTSLLISLLSDQQKTLGSLKQVLFLLNSRLDNGLAQTLAIPQWSEGSIRKQTGFDKFALTVIYDIISNFFISEGLVRDARDALRTVLSSPDQLDSAAALYVLRFSTRHEKLRRHFVAHNEVIGALMCPLEWTAKSPSDDSFPLIMDSLRYLINDDDVRSNVINHLSTRLDGTETGQTRLSVALEVNAPSKLMASLKMIASLAQYQPDLCKDLKPKIFELAEMQTSPVGSAAVEALAALNAPLTDGIHFSNILGYFGNTLPLLDVESGNTSSPVNTADLPPVLQVKATGRLDEKVMRKLVFTIESRDARERTAGTLALLKLCGNSMVRDFCLRVKVVHTFMRQLERKETSLLAVYAFNTCLGRGMVAPSDIHRAAQLIVAMLDKAWFDDALGRVEGSEIFRGLMVSGDLRQQVIHLGIVAILMKKFEAGEHHDVRMSLIYLDILVSHNSVELTSIVKQCIANLVANSRKAQMKGVKILSALAQTTAGEQAIKPHVIDIVKMLLPSSGSGSRPRSQLFGPTAALYDLSKNETLREEIQASREFSILKDQHRGGTLHSLPMLE